MSASAVATDAAPRRRLAAWQVDAVLLGAIVLVVVVVDYLFASRSFFFGDDFVNFEQARANDLAFGYLLPVKAGHAAPGAQLIVWLVQRTVGLNWDATLALFLACHAASVVLMQRILNVLFGRAWWTFALTFVFGMSVIYVAPLWWFSSSLLIFPSLALTLASLHAYLWWNEVRRWEWLAWSVAAMCLALAFYEKALLIPVYLVLIRVLLLRAGVREVAREWRVWLLYAAPLVLYVVVLATRHYGGGDIAVNQIPSYLRVSWEEGFAPAAFGVIVPATSETFAADLAIDLAQLVILVAIAVSVVRRPSAWRAWVFLALVFLLNALMVTSRLAPFGPSIGRTTRYFAETEAFVPLVIAFAFATPRTAAERAATTLRRPRGWLGAAALAGLLAYTGLVLLGDNDTVSTSTGIRVEPWVDNVRDGLAAARRDDPRPVLLDGSVPNAVVASFSDPPQNFLSSVVPLIDDRVRFNTVASDTYRVSPDGTVQAVTYVPAWTAPKRPCTRTLDERVAVRFQPPQPLTGHDFWLRATYRTSPGAALGLAADLGAGYQPQTIFALPAAPRTASRLAHVYTVPGKRRLVGVDLGIPPKATACFAAVQLGWFTPPA